MPRDFAQGRTWGATGEADETGVEDAKKVLDVRHAHPK
jgi:hypothetical protein